MTAPTLLDPGVLDAVTPAQLSRVEPFPWRVFDRLIRPGAFRELADAFPDLRLFERHEGRPRASGQRPHNRYYLAYDRTVGGGRPGVVGRGGLAPVWRALLEELESPPYLDRARELLDAEEVRIRFAWHVGVRGSEVSPHRDAASKYGTHIFYFNDRSNWDPAWGGATLMLGGPKRRVSNPEFEDFSTTVAGPSFGNASLLFRRSANSWHGVRALTCPRHARRRLFNVIFERAADGRAPGSGG
ncbi:MAG: 2OG-Fe(II) oxygenase [Acidobacteriota bacterium]